MIERITPQWLAGFFDGEGSVTIGARSGSRRSVTHPSYRLVVTLTQDDQGLIEAIRVLFPEFCPSRLIHGAGQAFQITLCGKKCRRFLEAIAPFSIRKYTQIMIALDFLETVKKSKTYPQQPITKENQAARTELYRKIHEAREEDSIRLQ